MLAVCGLIAGLGVLTMLQGLGAAISSFLICLGLLSAVAGYFYHQYSCKKAVERYEKTIAAAYRKLHCSKQRVLELGSDSFTVGCQCGTLTRPWSELTAVSENEKFFQLGAKGSPVIVPKTAFASESARTEFRALLSERLNRDRSIAARRLQFTIGPEDYKRASSLHNAKAGGWRFLVKRVAVLICAVLGAGAIVGAMAEPRNPAIVCGLFGAVLAGPLIRMAQRRRARYFGPLEIRFDEENLFLRIPGSEARQKWADYIGYLADDQVVVLYSHPQVYRIIPQRALTTNGPDFMALVESKLPKYDYRNPVLTQEPQPTTSAAN